MESQPTPVDLEMYVRPGLALAIGLLIGLQRERAKETPAGIRTFALISLTGYFVGILTERYSAGILVAGILFLGAALGIGNLIASRKKEKHGGGTTTEIAALFVFVIGAYLAGAEADKSFAVLFSGVTALLLYYKKPMHGFVKGLEAEDVRAIMQFVLITLVILPVIPNETYGPFDVINPFKAWLMVVLIVGIGLIGFLIYKVVGSRAGTLLSGLLGGLVSSTATTVSASRQARSEPSQVTAAALIIMIASTVSIVRMLLEMAAVNRKDLLTTGPPVAVFLLTFIVLSFVLYRKRSDEVVHLDPPENPAELKPALIFGILYVLILLGVAAAKEYFGQAGLYVVSIISGLTDIDAITLSTAELIHSGSLEPETGWRVILVAALSNVVFKAGMIAVIGGKHLLKRISLYYGIALAVGIAVIFLWPW